MAKIPHCDALFARFFAPWYDEEDRARLGCEITRPDMLQDPGLAGKEVREITSLNEDCAERVIQQLKTMARCALRDSEPYLGVHLELDLGWVDEFDRYWTAKRIADLIAKSDDSESSNDYFIICCTFGAAMGEVMLKLEPRLVWLPEWPYWESSILDPDSGTIIPPVHWAIKKMSSYGVDDGFAEKIEALVHLLDENR